VWTRASTASATASITGGLEGSDIDVVRQIAAAIFGDPNRVQFVVLDIADRVGAIERGQVDLVVNNFTVTCERQRKVEFSTAYLAASQRVLVPTDSKVTEIGNLTGARVCTSSGSTTETVLRAMPGLDVVTLPGIPDCMVELQRGRVAAVSSDDVILADATDGSPERVTALRFEAPDSPHLAAELAGRSIDPLELVDHIRARAHEEEAVIVEGVGGLLVPLTRDGYTVRDLARDLGFPLVIAARPGLGTISHTLLTLEAARSAGLDVRGVVLTPWPQAPSVVERSNLRTIAALGAVDVHTLPVVSLPTCAHLAAAAARLPVERWLAQADVFRPLSALAWPR